MATKLGSRTRSDTDQAVDRMEENTAAKDEFNTVRLFCKIMKKAEDAAQAT